MTYDSTDVRHDGRHDFDFLHGHWHSRQRKLKDRLAGCDEWEEFDTDLQCRPVLGGLGNIDELASPAMAYIGLALRRRGGRLHLHRHPPGHPGPGAIPVVRHHVGLRPLGAGLLNRRRRHLGDELDRRVQPGRRLNRVSSGSSTRDVMDR
jgi:hypothetical protein